MGIGAPSYWWGLLACVIPLLIHIIGRHRARVVPFAAIEFLLNSDLLTAQRFVLKEAWLMWIRTLLLATLAGAMLQPYVTCAGQRPMVEHGAQAAVLIIDDSFASGYRQDNATLLSISQRQAKAAIEDMGGDAELALLRTSQLSASGDLSRDHLLLLRRLSDMQPTFHQGGIAAAVRAAAGMLQLSRHENKSILVFSPLGEVVPPPPGVNLIYLDPRNHEQLPNVAVVGLSRDEAANDANGTSIVANATIANFGDRPVAGLGIRLYINDQVSARGLLEIPPRASVTKRFTVSLPSALRSAALSVRLDDDALVADNQRFMFIRRSEDARVLIVNGAPHLSRYQDEAFFLQTALGAAFRNQTPSQAGVEGLATQNFAAYDAIVLANVPALPPPQVARLHAWVAQGGGLFITAGDHVDPTNYNHAMAPLLPATLGEIADATWGTAPSSALQAAVTLAKIDISHPAFSGFSSDDPALTATSIRRRVLIAGVRPGARVLASTSDGAPVLVEHALGEGHVAFFASTINRDWSDLALQPGFAPWAAAMARYLGRKVAAPSDRTFMVGDAIAMPGDVSLRVTTPSGDILRPSDETPGLSMFRSTERPGIYRVQSAAIRSAERGAQAEPQARDDLGFAVNLNTNASDLSKPAAASTRVAQNNLAVVTHHRIALAPWLLALALILLLLEGLWLWR